MASDKQHSRLRAVSALLKKVPLWAWAVVVVFVTLGAIAVVWLQSRPVSEPVIAKLEAVASSLDDAARDRLEEAIKNFQDAKNNQDRFTAMQSAYNVVFGAMQYDLATDTALAARKYASGLEQNMITYFYVINVAKAEGKEDRTKAEQKKAKDYLNLQVGVDGNTKKGYLEILGERENEGMPEEPEPLEKDKTPDPLLEATP